MTKNKTVILGGGVAACSCAISLVKRGIKVSLLNRQGLHRKNLPVGEHLPPEGKPLLQILGLDNALSSPQHRESPGVISYWTNQNRTEMNYLFNPIGNGINLDRKVFNHDLMQASREAGVHIIDFERLSTISSQSSGHTIEITAGGESIKCHADFLIDATGRSAIAARKFGARRIRQDKLVGLYCHLENIPCLDSRLTIETMEDGWWYTAPLQNNHIAAVFMTDADLMPTGVAARQQFWSDRLSASSATSKRLGQRTELGKFQIVDAATQSLSQSCGDNWMAIGDAAMAFDPISAAGMTKALSSGIKAADAVIEHHGGVPFNSKTHEEDSARKFQNYQISANTAYAKVSQFTHSKFWDRRQMN